MMDASDNPIIKILRDLSEGPICAIFEYHRARFDSNLIRAKVELFKQIFGTNSTLNISHLQFSQKEDVITFKTVWRISSGFCRVS